MKVKQTADGSIRIADFEDWMRPGLVALFSSEYGGTLETENAFFDRFYEHPFQRSRAIRLVALEGEAVVGFQSLFYWPYRCGLRLHHSFQSGRSLVSPDHRGKGIFGRLLDHLDRNRERYGCEFLMGFPVEASYGSFLRNGWLNPFDLAWFVRPLNPLSLLNPKKTFEPGPSFETRAAALDFVTRDGIFELAEDESFLEWRRHFSPSSNHWYFHYREGGDTIRFDCKPNRRGWITELVIGGVRRTTDSPEKLKRALKALVSAARGRRSFATLSIAINERCKVDPLMAILRRSGFIRIRPRIHFITKSFDQSPVLTDPSRWILFRSDIDTW